MSGPDEAAITRLLAEHGWEWTDGFRELICDCDEFFADGYAEPTEGLVLRSNGQDTEIAAIGLHRAHVAAVLAAHMADREADAWDAGAKSVYEQFSGHSWSLDFYLDDNPFRLTPDTEGETK